MKSPSPAPASPPLDPYEEEFIREALEAEAQAERTGEYYTVEEVLNELDKILEAGKKRRGG